MNTVRNTLACLTPLLSALAGWLAYAGGMEAPAAITLGVALLTATWWMTEAVPIGAASLLSSKLVRGSTLKVYPGAPHGLPTTHKDQVNADLLEFFKIK
mgnify:CR=1 FL=1